MLRSTLASCVIGSALFGRLAAAVGAAPGAVHAGRAPPLGDAVGSVCGRAAGLSAAAADARAAGGTTAEELIADAIPSRVLVGQAGVPKWKSTVQRSQRKREGVHFKHKFLRYQPWYYCPLCAEPKQQGTCCRREDCREIKP